MPTLLCALLLCITGAKPVHHYVFVGQDRERIHDAHFLETPALEGAQVAYSWRQLEPGKDEYDFSEIREDLAFLAARGKKLFVQFQDVTFDSMRVGVPKYLLSDPQYHGGANRQKQGWAARRWDPAVQARLYKLFDALGREFDGRIEGINLAETSVEFEGIGRPLPGGFTYESYRDAIIANLQALKRAFPKSVALQYGNFMPGEWRPSPDDNKGYLEAVYAAARAAHVGVGGPDLLPHRPGQLKSSYPLIRESAGIIPTGIAVQDGNYEHVDPATGKQVTIDELMKFAIEYLKVDYIFWCTQEPFYSRDVIPALRNLRN